MRFGDVKNLKMLITTIEIVAAISNAELLLVSTNVIIIILVLIHQFDQVFVI